MSVNEDRIVREGHLKKKNEWYIKQERRFVLYKSGKIEYFEPKKNEKRGSFQLTYNCEVHRVTANQFDVSVPGRVYNLYSVLDHEPVEGWVQDLNSIIRL